MQQPRRETQPWRWKRLIRSRALEWFWFALALFVSLLFVLGLIVHGTSWLDALPAFGLLIGACLGAGFWNRVQRRQEKAHRLLP
jgi:hypothetical protein